MTTIVGYGDRLITPGGSVSWLKRGSQPLSAFGFSASQALEGRTVSYQQLYEEQPWISVVVNKINRQIVRLPLRVMRHLDDGEIEPVEREHELVQLLERPWPRASGSTLKQKITFPALVHGNALLAKIRPSGGAPPTELRPLDWRFIEPIIIAGELEGWCTSEFGERQMLAADDVVHLAFEGGRGPLGVSPLTSLGVSVRAEDSAQRYQQSSFENGARPSGALVLPPEVDIDEGEREELRAAIRGMHGGSDRAANIALLSGGVDWKPFAHTAVEAELIEQRRLNREEIAAVYDVDPPMIGILDHATYSNVGEMHRMLYGPTLGPWLKLETDTLNAQLIDAEPRWEAEGLFVAFDLTEVLKANTGEEMAAVVSAIGSAVMTPNEGRQRFGLRRSDEEAADELYLPANNLTALRDEEPEEEDEDTVEDDQIAPEDGVPAALQGSGDEAGAPLSEDADEAADAPKALSPLERHHARWHRIADAKAAQRSPLNLERFRRELAADVPDADVELELERFTTERGQA